MKRSLCWILALIMMISIVLGATSCNKDSGDGEGTTAATTTVAGGGGDQSNLLKLVENGAPAMTIVYQKSVNKSITESVNIINRAVKNACGAEMKSISDLLCDHKNDAYEILIGSTSYDASTEALGALGKNSYSITVSGNKIVIAATNAFLYPIAAEKLVSALASSNGSLSLSNTYTFTSESYSALSFVNAGKSDYRIVYNEATEGARDAAFEIKSAVYSAAQVTLEVVSDAEDEEGKELLIGYTNRDLSGMEDSYYKNAWIGKDKYGNIAITGNLEGGVDKFIEYIYTLGTKGGNIDLLEDMFGNFTPAGTGNAPLYEGSGNVEVMDSLDVSKSYTIFANGASKSDFEEYTDMLLEEGYYCFYSTSANGQTFETWTDGYTILTIAHISYADPRIEDPVINSIGPVSYVSISVDCVDNSALPARDSNTKAVTTEMLITLPGSQLAFVLRLKDGRFVIFDGGVDTMADTIYDLLCDYNELDGKPTVAAWYVTHGHGDHIGAPNAFIQAYSKDVNIESFVHHLPSRDQYYGKNTQEIDQYAADNLYAASQTFYEAIKRHYPSADIIVAHAGQRFEFGDTKIDVLFTPENLYKKQMYDTNASSVIYSITGKTGRMIVLGDSVNINSSLLYAIYEDALKADVVQVAHHGYNNGDEEMYESIDATYAIWSNSLETVVGSKLHIKANNLRNRFDYTSVDYNLIPSSAYGAEPIILAENSTRGDIAEMDAGLTG